MSIKQNTKISNNQFENPEYYFNRELSWLDFNYRVIDEAYDPNNPLLEQLNFLAIGTSNADEFFMVRVAGVVDQYLADIEISENKTQMTPDELLEQISLNHHRNTTYQYRRYHSLVNSKLPSLNYHMSMVDNLTPDELLQAKAYYHQLVLPTLSPLGIDAYRPFPMLKNNAINIFVQLSKDGEEHSAIVPIPTLLDRYIIVDANGKNRIIFIEDLIIQELSTLFEGYEIQYAFPFRITRSADFDIKEDNASDLINLIEDYIKKRRTGIAIRLEIDTRFVPDFNKKHYKLIAKSLELNKRSIHLIDGPIDLTFLFGLADKIGETYPEHRYPDFNAYLNPEHTGESLFESIKQGDLFFNHPYDSFKPVVSLVEEAATDPNTIAIKQTLYRVSKHSPIIQALKTAAENGKEVTVLVELKARFDEENNVFWAKELEEAGCHVIYGVSDLKTHSKITMIVRREGNAIRRYVHLGTGNYNDKTAKTYTDMGLMTADIAMGEDAAKFFNFISGYTELPEYTHLHVSPFAIRDSLIDYIDEEIELHKQHGDGRIVAKMNSLTDKPLIQKLYEASQAGVRIDLIVRGICCLKPGIPGISENIHVRSIVGRFLEHSRIYAFNNHGDSRIFLSSADMMTRNMTKRVEIEFPILDEKIETEIAHVLELQLEDNLKARELQVTGDYTRPERQEGEALNSQEQQMIEANQRKNNLIEEKKQIQKSIPWFDRIWRRFRKN
ncbi:RNA degradosome polyphosphate kinase [Aerococcaceae bacterium DSM 111022]|nr:RNA degradosome polyphosphate kinase [Aerococcaceae bacterium DSM 111022]